MARLLLICMLIFVCFFASDAEIQDSRPHPSSRLKRQIVNDTSETTSLSEDKVEQDEEKDGIKVDEIDREEDVAVDIELISNDDDTTDMDEELAVEEIELLEENFRLPKHLYPLHYDLYLHPDLESGLFNGQVTILIQALDTTNYILTHMKDLIISDTKLTEESGRSISISRTYESPKNEFWVVLPSEELPIGNYSLTMEFSGNLTRGITGFYMSKYTNAQGDKVPIATSKFQPTYARKAFPCFDEPSFKSTFTISLVRPSERYSGLSNMPVECEEADSPNPGLTTVKFQKSVPMVTYLACFIVSDFQYQEKFTEVHNTKFRVYATPQQKETVEYSLNIGANITDFFTNYFELPYPLPKQDMVAIPDYVSGATEHWGLITYRETNLLFDTSESSSLNQQRVAKIVSHELAHQWFGNLVTLEWWDDLWLNEGFAVYMSYKGVANYHDDWEITDQFLSTDLHKVLDLDATLNSHPIIQEVNTADQITEIFDTISYSKGASVLRMLENFMGEKEFQAGIHAFLEKYQYENAVTNDLWREMEKVKTSDLPITEIMDTWTRQMGYPVLNVEKTTDTIYRITQTRYLTDSSAESDDDSPYDYKWDIPLTWISSSQSEPNLIWFFRDESMLEVEVPEGTEWVKFNVGQFGYYRVNYPVEEWKNLAQLLVRDSSALSSTDRASLLNDAFSLAQSGHLSYDVPLSMTKYLKYEKNLVPWKTVLDKMVTMKELLMFTDTFPLLQDYILELVEDHYSRLGWQNEGSHAGKLNRNDIITLACGSGHAECKQKASQLFRDWLSDPDLYISPNIREAVYTYGMASAGDQSSWNTVFDRFLTEVNAQQKKKLMKGLSQIREPWLIHKFLRLSENETIVRSQDYFTVLTYVSENPVGNLIVWDYFRSEWPNIVDRFTLNDRYLGRVPKAITKYFSSQFQLDQVEGFFAKYPEAGAGARARKQAVEQIKLNIKWVEDHQAVIHNWLENRNSLSK